MTMYSPLYYLRQNLYVMQYEDLFKIGVSCNPEQRKYSLGLECSFDIDNIHVLSLFEFKEPMTVEKQIHNKFRNKKVHGEWFLLFKDDYDWILNTFNKQLLIEYNKPNFDYITDELITLHENLNKYSKQFFKLTKSRRVHMAAKKKNKYPEALRIYKKRYRIYPRYEFQEDHIKNNIINKL